MFYMHTYNLSNGWAVQTEYQPQTVSLQNKVSTHIIRNISIHR